MADDEMMTDAPGGGFNWADEVTAEHAASGHDAAVLEAERVKAKKRAERFGQEYKEPKANVVARGLMSRKEVLAMRKEQALKKMNRRGEFVAGIDVFDPEEEAKRAARASAISLSVWKKVEQPSRMKSTTSLSFSGRFGATGPAIRSR